MSWISRLNVWTKLMLSFAAVSIITVAVGYLGFSSTTTLNQNIADG